jgi:dihydropteroate synthase
MKSLARKAMLSRSNRDLMIAFNTVNKVPAPVVQFPDRELSLLSPQVMGILNLTTDSFYDGGRFSTIDLALFHVEKMIEEGATLIDVGAESSRPFAKAIPVQEEIDRIAPVLSAIKERFNILLSVDTYKPPVMEEAVKLGVHMINDIYALQQPGALEVVAANQVAVVLMHIQHTPLTMQLNPSYQQVVADVGDFLARRVMACLKAGIGENRIIIDPGFGFGKTTLHNMQLLKNLSAFKKMGYPLLVGLSRKSSIGELLALPVEERLFGSVSAHVIAVLKGASIIRAHDIKPTVEALKIAEAVLSQESLAWQ